MLFLQFASITPSLRPSTDNFQSFYIRAAVCLLSPFTRHRTQQSTILVLTFNCKFARSSQDEHAVFFLNFSFSLMQTKKYLNQKIKITENSKRKEMENVIVAGVDLHRISLYKEESERSGNRPISKCIFSFLENISSRNYYACFILMTNAK